MLEKKIKKQITDYLQKEQSNGRLVFLRLNVGQFRTKNSYIIHGCPKGTADLLVLKDGVTIFVETKSTTGKQTTEQIEFQSLVQDQGAWYGIARSLDGLKELLSVTN